MATARILYARVSTAQQNLDRQLVDMDGYDKVYMDKMSGKDRNRPQLEACIDFAREGDVVEVWELSRLARSLADLLDIIAELNAKGVTVRFLKENLVFAPNATDHMSTFQMQILGAVAQLERSLIKERQLEGIAIAKAAGKFKGGTKKITAEQEAEIRQLLADGESAIEIAKTYGISRQSVYNIKKSNA